MPSLSFLLGHGPHGGYALVRDGQSLGSQARQVRLGANPLSQDALDGSGEGQADMGWETGVHFFKGQKNPAMLENIKNPGKVPKGRKNDRDLLPNPGQFLVKADWIFHVLKSVRTENGLELMVLKRQRIDRVDQNKTG
jgi:hypothetical protein